MKKVVIMLVAVLLCFTVDSFCSQVTKLTHHEAQQLLDGFDSIQDEERAVLGSVKDCDELSLVIDELVKNNRSLLAIKNACAKRIYVLDDAAIDALGIMHQHIPDEIGDLQQNDIFASLQVKNKIFRALIERFISKKAVELEQVTGTTLDLVLSSEFSLGSLPYALKQYVFAKALDCFYVKHSKEHTYIFKGHTDTIKDQVNVLVKKGIKEGLQLVTGANDKTVRFWNTRTGLCDYVYSCAAPVTDLSHCGNTLFIAIATNSNDVILLDSCGYTTTQLSHKEPIYSICSSGKHLLACTEKSRVYLWNVDEKIPVITAEFTVKMEGAKANRGQSFCKLKGNELHYTYEDKNLTICKAALANCATKKIELEKIAASQSVEKLSEISRMPFKIALAEKIMALENGPKK